MGTWESGVGNSRMAKLLLAKLVRDLWKMEFKDMETTLGDIKSTWQWKWQGNWEVLREWTAKLLEVGVGFGKENQRMKNHANYFEKPRPS